MSDADLARKMAALQQSISKLRQALEPDTQRPAEGRPPSWEALQDALEELEVAQDELQQQQDELAAAHYLLEAERHRYQESFNYAPDGYLVTDAQGVIQEANRAAAALLHRCQDALVGKSLVLYVAAADRRALRGFLSRLPQQPLLEQAWEVSLQPQPGTPVPVALTVTVARDPQGKITRVRWLLHDITERKRLQELPQQERHLLQVTLASIGDAVIATDLTATLTFLNPVAEALTGWTAQEALGRKAHEVVCLLDEQTRQPLESPVDKVLRKQRVVELANHTLEGE